MKHSRRHIWVYRILRVLIRPFFKWRMGFSCKPTGKIAEPYLVLANHNLNLDPALLALSFPRHMYFVASEHIFRWGLASRLIVWLFAPIARAKGSTDARTVMDILNRLHAGYNVCIFAEGNRSFNGLTGEILPSTGKLAKISGATLVTYKLEGGYFTSPRWGKALRRGKMHGYVVQQYSADMLKQMTAQQVNELIERDLYEDAYLRQQSNPVRYKGKRLAEHLEMALYLCPACERISTLHSCDDHFYCDCGLEGRYTELGELLGDKLVFHTITEWDAWQTQKLIALTENDSQEPLCTDREQSLYRVQAASNNVLLVKDTLIMYRDRLVCGAYSFPISEISDIAIYGRMALIFKTKDGGYYEVISDFPRSATKYLTLYRALRQKSAQL